MAVAASPVIGASAERAASSAASSSDSGPSSRASSWPARCKREVFRSSSGGSACRHASSTNTGGPLAASCVSAWALASSAACASSTMSSTGFCAAVASSSRRTAPTIWWRPSGRASGLTSPEAVICASTAWACTPMARAAPGSSPSQGSTRPAAMPQGRVQAPACNERTCQPRPRASSATRRQNAVLPIPAGARTTAPPGRPARLARSHPRTRTSSMARPTKRGAAPSRPATHSRYSASADGPGRRSRVCCRWSRRWPYQRSAEERRPAASSSRISWTWAASSVGSSRTSRSRSPVWRSSRRNLSRNRWRGASVQAS
eukprot:Opistho-1_new@68330